MGPSGGTPGLIGDDAFGGAIGIVDLELGQQRQPISVDVAPPTIEAESTPVPAIAQHGADGVASFMQADRSHRTSDSAGDDRNWSIRDPEHDRRR